MTNAPYSFLPKDERDGSMLTGARLLVMEKCFAAVAATMIEQGAMPEVAVVSILDFLAEGFLQHEKARRAQS